ncbi:hypothetical protein [Streptomyces sp900116325]|uniref:hypothetical protein n=1 Tax=Streptomyces sp. 900116325 TaxID=3154295 RepID=UPI0033DC8787
MATVEMHVATELLDEFDTIRGQIEGREVRRRTHPTRAGVTILDMEMADAPPQATQMEPVLTMEHGQVHVREIHYWDRHGIFLAPVVAFPPTP